MDDLLYWITITAGFLPIVYFLVAKPRLSKELKFMMPYVWLLAIASAYEPIFTKMLHVKSDWWFRIYTLLDFVGVYYFFYWLLAKRFKPFFWSVAAIFGIGFIWLLFLWKSENHLDGDSYLTTIETFFIYTCAFLWFKDIFTELSLNSPWTSGAFYFISSLVIYYSGTFFLFALGGLFDTDKNFDFDKLWRLNVVLSLVLRLLIFTAIWKGQQRSLRYSG